MTASLNLAGLVDWFDEPLTTISDQVLGTLELMPLETTFCGTIEIELSDMFTDSSGFNMVTNVTEPC